MDYGAEQAEPRQVRARCRGPEQGGALLKEPLHSRATSPPPWPPLRPCGAAAFPRRALRPPRRLQPPGPLRPYPPSSIRTKIRPFFRRQQPPIAARNITNHTTLQWCRRRKKHQHATISRGEQELTELSWGEEEGPLPLPESSLALGASFSRTP